jgi:hypothetical protein
MIILIVLRIVKLESMSETVSLIFRRRIFVHDFCGEYDLQIAWTKVF